MFISKSGHLKNTTIAYVVNLLYSISIATFEAIDVIFSIFSSKLWSCSLWSFLVLSVFSLIVYNNNLNPVGIAFNTVALHSALCVAQWAL